jgi:ABC-2 type transport system ATP-binding protein
MQALRLVGEIRGASRRDARARASELIETLAIGEWAGTSGTILSGGVSRLVAFAMAAMVPGNVVILDEPTNDVDPLRRRLLWEQVGALASRGSAVLLVTHNVLEAERAVDRLAILDGGRVVAAGTPASLKRASADRGNFRLEVILEPGMAGAGMPCDLPPSVREPVLAGRRILGEVAEPHIEAVVGWARQAHELGRIEEFSFGPTTLEDVYVRLVRDREAAA